MSIELEWAIEQIKHSININDLDLAFSILSEQKDSVIKQRVTSNDLKALADRLISVDNGALVKYTGTGNGTYLFYSGMIGDTRAYEIAEHLPNNYITPGLLQIEERA